MNEFFGSVWWLIVTLGVLITFHEYGHFVVARWCGVKVLRFSVGFGKPLWSRFDRHGTEFAIAAIPLGGYVKMLDEREGEVAPAELDRAHNRKPVLQRMAIAVAGPAFNLVFAVFAFWLMFVIGKPDYQPLVGEVDGIARVAGFQSGDRLLDIDGEPVETWTDASLALVEGTLDHRDLAIRVSDARGDERTRILALSTLPPELDEGAAMRRIGLTPLQFAVPAVIGTVQPGSAADRAGLRPGDRLVAIDGEAIDDWRDVQDAIPRLAAADGTLRLDVERDDQRLEFAASPRREAQADGSDTWVLGVTPQPVQPAYDATLHHGPIAAVPAALVETWQLTGQTLGMLWRMLVGTASLQNISGVITIAQYANTSAHMGLAWFLNFLAMISLSLAILNLLPIPILDGGHLLYYLIELVKGSPVSENVQVVGQYAGLVLLIALMGLAFYNDILRLAS
jgi:regulator of sigma E protease